MSAGAFRGRLANQNLRAGVGLVMFGSATLAAGGDWSARSWIFPSLLSASLIIIGVLLIVVGVTRGAQEQDRSRSGVDALAYIAAVIAYFALLAVLGYLVATVMLAWGLSVWLGERRDWPSLVRKLIGCVLGVAVLYVLFGGLLNVPLPSGAL
jgi:uncharacterized membrane protein YidH (DUF202 family)